MSNVLLTDDVISLEALDVLENSLVLAKCVERDKQALFDHPNGSARGATVRVRKPNFSTLRTGRTFAAQDITDDYLPFTINTQIGADFTLTSQEMAQSLSSFSDQIIKPAVARIANEIDLQVAKQFVNVANSVGTPGSAASTLSTFLSAGVKLDQASCPRDGQRYMVVGPQGQADIVDALKGLFNSQSKLAGQYETGQMARNVAGFNWDMDQNIQTMTSGPRGGTPIVNGTVANGATTIVTSGWTASAANRLKAGDVFTLSNSGTAVGAVNVLSKNAYGVAKQFVTVADVASDGTGAATITVQEPIYYTGPRQNVDSQILNAATFTFLSAASTVSAQHLGGYKSAITLGFCPLPKPEGVDMASTKTDKNVGVSIRFIRFYDGTNDAWNARFDVMYGIKVLRPEWLVRVHGAVA